MTTRPRHCVWCGVELPATKIGRPRTHCEACSPSRSAQQQRADPNVRRRGNLRTINEALVNRLRRQGVQAQLSLAPDGRLEVTRPCIGCGVSISVTKLGRPRTHCDDCRAQRHAEQIDAWRQAHADYGRDWRAAHRDEMRNYQRDFARNNPERMATYRRKYADEHREELNARARRWRAAHRDLVNEQLRRRRAENPGAHAAAMRRWRAAQVKPPESAE
jgi:hypothetical protein